uniref:S-protein homolog n=2 Tax=Cicer arietinum TaxID=3827 RepID=A0A1S2Z4M5_CICAR
VKETKSLFLPKLTVHVTNNLTGGLQLGVDCKDKNTDFGFRALHTGESYDFTFRPRPFIRRSLYFCSFSWITGFHHFDIYVETRDQDDCEKHCNWVVKESGPCKIKAGSIECFHWNPEVVSGDGQLSHTLNV